MMNNEVENKEACQNGVCASKATCAAKPRCKCIHHLAWPIIVIALGLVMLLSVLGVIGSAGTGVAFSLIVIILGISMAMKRMCNCCCGK